MCCMMMVDELWVVGDGLFCFIVFDSSSVVCLQVPETAMNENNSD